MSLTEARAAVEAQLRAGARGAQIAADLTDAVDAEVRAVFEASQPPPGLALLATGGYGRRELAPNSDVDLLFLSENPQGAAEAVQATLHGLWDLGLQIGYSTGTVAQSVALAREDLHTATALFTARGVAGEPGATHSLRAALELEFSADVRVQYLRALETNMEARHERYGGSVYLLEPNLKQSPGGLRDLTSIWWASAVAFRVHRWPDLVTRGVCSPQAEKVLARARDYLLRVRVALHTQARYGGDRLTFQHQANVAAVLGHGEGREAVERFMATYYRHASVVKKWSRILVDRCIEAGAPRRPHSSHAVDEAFSVVDGYLTLRDPGRLAAVPADVMRMFAVAREQGVPLHGSAKELAMEAVPRLVADDEWRRDPLVVEAFCSVLGTPEDPYDALGDMHEAGVLGTMLPEFGAVTHRTHHDLYHVYTVDIHTLHAIRRLKALHRGELTDSEPLLSQAMALVDDHFVLYLGLLMHDAGKALGSGHAVKGAELLPGIGRRLSLSPKRTRRAAWLVRDHLLMAHISQRRDPGDEDLIRQFARQVGDQASLAMLFILTWADASTTGPQAYTDWKAALLAELYARAGDRMRRGLDLYEDPTRAVHLRRTAVTRWLVRNGDTRVTDVNGAVDRFFAGLPTAYFQKTRARTVARHLELLERLAEEPPVVLEVVPRPKRGYSTLHVAALERSGLLATIAGVLALHDLDVLMAELHLATSGHALDMFRVRLFGGGAPPDDASRWSAIQNDLRGALSGDLDVARLLAARRSSAGRFRWPEGPPVDRRIRFDQTTSETCTVFDVRCRDRPGLLFTLIQTIDAPDVRIAVARIATENDAAHDTFYVAQRAGGRLPAERATEVVDAINAALDAQDEAGRADAK